VQLVKREIRKRIRSTLIVLIIAGFPATCMYKYRVADAPERRCGMVNLFKWDYSVELAAVTFSADESDVRVDFTRLNNWKKICLVSMYEEDINGPVQERPWEGLSYTAVGRWQCSGGNPEDAITVALIKSDGGTLARQVKIPEQISRRLIGTNYGGGLGDDLYEAGYRVCADIDEAVARCAWIEARGRRGCFLVFRPRTTRQ
jgi:hypothetical protein